MFRLKLLDKGFSLVELLITILLIGIVGSFFFGVFNGSLIQYFDIQKQGTNFGNLASQSYRIANVLRGSTDIIAAGQDDLTVYAYFSPADAYVSKVRYYKNSANTILYADVTRMTANPPIGLPISSSLKTYKIIENFNQVSGIKLFTYKDAVGTELLPPIADLHTVKAIQIKLAVQGAKVNSPNQAIDVQISLRNRKTNL